MRYRKEQKNSCVSVMDWYTPTNLLCEHASNPLGLDVTLPRFSWTISSPDRGQTQSAYQVLVATKRSKLRAGDIDMWDSAKVVSDESQNVVYGGNPLESGKTYYWQVRVWDRNGKVRPYSEVDTFEMGLLKKNDWQGEWISFSGGKAGEALLFRKEFALHNSLSRARAYICGLGYYELRINGKKVGDHVLDPGWTEYSKRVLYVTYDVTKYLKEGKNAMGVMVGNGWYGFPQMIFQMNMEFTDGKRESIVSDCTWMVAGGPVRKNSIYDGEVYDARLEKTGWGAPRYKQVTAEGKRVKIGPDWMWARRVEGPGGVMKSQVLEPIKVVSTIRPIQTTNPKPDTYVFDMGQNMVGWIRLNVEGPAGTKVILKFAELLYEDGTVNQENLWVARATDTYILKGERQEIYEPHFTYHGFRYVQVKGFPGTPTADNLEGRVVHSAVEPIGSFTCSNELLNQIQKNILWGVSGNLHSIPSDCPQRSSRLAWLGDATVGAETAIYNFRMLLFYTKWLDDIKDAQDKKTGNIPDTAPCRWGGKATDPAWGSVYVLLPWYLYQYYGDRRILEQHYNGMQHWVKFLGTKADNHIVSYCRSGDWCPPIKECYAADISEAPLDSAGALTNIGAFPANTPGALTSTGYYYYSTLILFRIADILGKAEETKKYSKLAGCIKEAFNNRFLNKNTNQYASGSQCCNAFSLFLGLVPEENKKAVLKNLIEDIMVFHKGHFTTGILGTKYLMEVLTNHGRGDIAYTLVTQTTYPSWGYMISKDATTIWERWEYMTGRGMNSHNHYMFASVGAWFYKALAGINSDPDGPGYQRIVIRPNVVGDLNYVNASVKTIRGMVSSSWRKFDNSLTLNVVLPVNSRAKVSVPKLELSNITIKESGKTVWRNGLYIEGNEGIMSGSEDNRYVTFEIGSGSYFFEISGTP